MHTLRVLLAQGPPRTTCLVASDVTRVVYLGDPGAVSRAGRKGATKVFKHECPPLGSRGYIYIGKPVGPWFGQMVRKILDCLNFVLDWIAFTLPFIQISSIYRKTSVKAWNWYQRWLWRKGTSISVSNIPTAKTWALSIQPKRPVWIFGNFQ